MFAHLKFGRADQIADVLHPEQIEAGRIEALAQQLEAATHHRRIEVTGPARGDRHHRDPHGLQAFGIELGGHVPLQHGHRKLIRELGQAALQQGGFACPRTAHHVEAKQPPAIKMLAVVFGLVLIGS